MTAAEFAADRLVHFVGLALGIVAAVALVVVAAVQAHVVALATVAAYVAGLLAMLSFSAAYNLATRSPRRELLRRLDHAAIFAMIAGTYTPFTVMGLSGGWAVGMTIAVWAIALLGIVLKLSIPASRFEGLSTGLYLAFGWIGFIAVGPLIASVGLPLLVLLGIGGLVYSVGAIFHVLERVPYQKAIWHGSVLVAAGIHYAAIIGLVAG
jgi:hemolysin III